MHVDHVVAITRLPVTGDSGGYRSAPNMREQLTPEALVALTGLLGGTAYDLRLRLAGEAPWPVARLPQIEAAERLVVQLHERGFGAVRASQRECGHRAWPPRAPLTPGVTGLTDAAGREVVSFARVWLLVAAVLDQERGEERIEQILVARTQQGGPVTADVSRYQYERKRRRALYVFDDQPTPLFFLQDEQISSSLHARTGRERLEAFQRTLQERCPHAILDDRLARSPRKRTSFVAMQPTSEGRDEVTSNASETDLAAHLLAQAWRLEQIG